MPRPNVDRGQHRHVTEAYICIYIYIYIHIHTYKYIYIYIHTHMPRPNVDRGQHRHVTEALLSYGRDPRTQDTSLSYRMPTMGSFRCIKRKGCEVNRTPGATADVKNARCYTCTPPSGSNALCLIAQGDIYTVTPKSDPSQTAANPALYSSIRQEELPELPQTDAVCLQRQGKRLSTSLGPPGGWWINPISWLENTVLRNPVAYKLQNGAADCKQN